MIAQQLHQSCSEKDESLQKLSFEVQRVKVQLQDQISPNHDVMAQFDSAKSQTQRLLGHPDQLQCRRRGILVKLSRMAFRCMMFKLQCYLNLHLF